MISFKKINLNFSDKIILSDLSLEIEQNQKVSIFGKSGIGKSSIFNLILGFEKPVSGEIKIDNMLVNELNIWEIRKKIAFIDQDISITHIRTIDWITSIFKFKANSHLKFDTNILNKLLDEFELSNLDINKFINELSGGERQRVAIIASILLNRKIYLLDEITSALDVNLKHKVVDHFTSKDDITVLVNSHDTAWINNPKIKVFDLKEKEWKQ